MWRSVIEELEVGDMVGTSLPIRCERHPERVVQVSEPGALPKIAPDGTLFGIRLAFAYPTVLPVKVVVCNHVDSDSPAVICALIRYQ